MEDKNLQLLANLLESLDSKTTLDEIAKALEVVIIVVEKSYALTQEELEKLRSMYNEAILESKNVNNDRFETLKARLTGQIESKLQTLKDGKNGIDGKDADEEKIVEEVLNRLPTPEPQKVLTDIEIRDMLESLKKGEKLSIQAIEDLPEIIAELKKKKGGLLVGGGGMNAIPMHFVDDETPSGTMNGVNTDFNTNLIPATGSLKVFRNGQRLKVTEDYTLSGQTITFINPPESDEIILVDYRT